MASGKIPEPPPIAELRPAGDVPRDRAARAQDIGGALRTAYENTVNEEIPAAMLDLLAKLR